jgi:hypothetical protein
MARETNQHEKKTSAKSIGIFLSPESKGGKLFFWGVGMLTMGRNRPTRKRGKNISSIYSHPIQSPKDLLILHSSVCMCVCVCAEFLRANKKPNLKIVSSVFSLSLS